MLEIFDAHIHLFEAGYESKPITQRFGVDGSEIAYYQFLTEKIEKKQALVVGYAAEPWCENNNAYIAGLAQSAPSLHTLAYVDSPGALTVTALEAWHKQAFVGISLYLFDPESIAGLALVSDEVWQWLVSHRWLISVNGKAPCWRQWYHVLERHRDLCLLASHLGLPDAITNPMSLALATERLKSIAALSAFDCVHVKLSGFYAVVQSGRPQSDAWPYMQVLLESFGPGRLVWGSDFSPCLGEVSFPETYQVLQDAPFIDQSQCERMMYENMYSLIENIL